MVELMQGVGTHMIDAKIYFDFAIFVESASFDLFA